MKLVSWNVNGLRACMGKGFLAAFQTLDGDVFCLQETKLQPEQLQLELPGYHMFWNSAEKKGYSGTALFTRLEPMAVTYDIGDPDHVGEGRAITMELPECYVVTVYTPNAQEGLARIDYRMAWEDALRKYLCELDGKKPVILCGDLNVAHQEIDLKNPGPNRGKAGFSDQERGKFTQLLDAGFVDSFRFLHPDAQDAYSWWSYRFHARERNAGWRIDYFVLSQRLTGCLRAADIHSDVLGSDHCPVSVELDLDAAAKRP